MVIKKKIVRERVSRTTNNYKNSINSVGSAYKLQGTLFCNQFQPFNFITVLFFAVAIWIAFAQYISLIV